MSINTSKGLDFAKKFGAAVPAKADKPVAQFWLNIGYGSGVVGADGVEKFVSLPMGIALDTMEPVKTNSSNVEYSAFMAAKNDLMEQILAVAEQLAPGEEKNLNLEIQLRRVAAPHEAIDPAQNAFVKKLAL